MKSKKRDKRIFLKIIFFGVIGLILSISMNQKASATEVSSYFNWKNEWQENQTVTVTSSKQQSSEIQPPTLYNRAIANEYSFNLFEGDTKPVLNSSGYTFGLSTPVTALSWPVINSVDPIVSYEYSNPTYWKGLPTNDDGRFNSTKSSWPSEIHWSGWPDATLKTTAYVVYPKGPTKDDWISYTFSDDVPNNITMGTSTQINIDNSYEKPKAPKASWLWGIGWNIEIPQVVKAVFKDIDNPEGPTITNDEIAGYGGEIADTIILNNKKISGYNFVSSQIVLGPTIRNSFGIGTTAPSAFRYDETTSIIKDATVDTKWETTLDRQQKGIVWWYQKAEVTPTLSKSVDKSSAAVSQELNYTLVAGNSGNSELTDPLITDVLPTDSVSEPTDVTIELSDGTKRSIGKGIENSNTFGEYYEYINNNQLLFHLGSVLDKGATKKISYKTKLIQGNNGESKVNTATLSGENTTNKATASASITVNNGTIRLLAPAIVTFGEAKLPKSIGTNLNRNPDFQIQVVDDRVVKDDFYVTAIESAPFTHSDTISMLNAPLIFKQEDSTEQSITESDAALVFQPQISQSDQPVTYNSTWAKDQGLMLKVPSNSKVGAYTGEITWNLNVGP